MNTRASSEAGSISDHRVAPDSNSAQAGEGALADDAQLYRLQMDLSALVERAAYMKRLVQEEKNAHPGEDTPELDRADNEALDMLALAESVRQEVNAPEPSRNGKKRISKQRVSELTYKVEHELHTAETHINTLLISEKAHDTSNPSRHSSVMTSHISIPHPIKQVAKHTIKASPAVGAAIATHGKLPVLHPTHFDPLQQIHNFTHHVEHRAESLWQSAPVRAIRHYSNAVVDEVSEFTHAPLAYTSHVIDKASQKASELREEYISKPLAKAKAATMTYVDRASTAMVEAGKSSIQWVSAASGRVWSWVAGDDEKEKLAKAAKAKEEASNQTKPAASPSMLDSLAKAVSLSTPITFVFHEVDGIVSISGQALPYAQTLFSNLQSH